MEKLKSRIENRISLLEAEPSELNNAKIEALREVLEWITPSQERDVFPFKAECIRQDEAGWFTVGKTYVYRLGKENEPGKVYVNLHNGEGVSIYYFSMESFYEEFKKIES